MSLPRNETHLTPPPPSGLDQYKLVRLSNVDCGDIWKIFDEMVARVNEVPSIVELDDGLNNGSFEILVLKSYCLFLQDMLKKILPGSNVDLNYNPVEPADKDTEDWGVGARKLRELWFCQRAVRMVKEGGPVEAAYYAHLLTFMDLTIAAAGLD